MPSERLMSTCFAEFYEELARIKQAALLGRLSGYLGGMNTSKTGGADLAASVSSRLRALLADQHKRVQDEANHLERSSYGLARYFMVALADEVLGVRLPWDGMEYWQDQLLERALFGRSVAGRDFYLVTDRVLESRGQSKIMQDLAAVALMCLQLGFEGQLCGPAASEQRDRYRARLLNFIGCATRVGRLRTDAKPLFENAYQGLTSESSDQRLAPFGRWYVIAAALIAAYLLVSTTIWLATVANITEVLPATSTASLAAHP